MRRDVSNPEFVRWASYFAMLEQREELQAMVARARAKRGG